MGFSIKVKFPQYLLCHKAQHMCWRSRATLKEHVNSCLADQGVPRKGEASFVFLNQVEMEVTDPGQGVDREFHKAELLNSLLGR